MWRGAPSNVILCDFLRKGRQRDVPGRTLKHEGEKCVTGLGGRWGTGRDRNAGREGEGVPSGSNMGSAVGRGAAADHEVRANGGA